MARGTAAPESDPGPATEITVLFAETELAAGDEGAARGRGCPKRYVFLALRAYRRLDRRGAPGECLLTDESAARAAPLAYDAAPTA